MKYAGCATNWQPLEEARALNNSGDVNAMTGGRGEWAECYQYQL